MILNLKQKIILKKVINRSFQGKHNKTFTKIRIINLIIKKVIILETLESQLLLNLILYFYTIFSKEEVASIFSKSC